MKKLLVALCFAIMCFALFACGSSTGSSASSSAESSANASVDSSEDSASSQATLSSSEESASTSASSEQGESMLQACMNSIDEKTGAHLEYEEVVESLGSDSSFIVNAKDGKYCSERTTKVSGYENTSYTVALDGKVMSVSPETKVATVVTTVPSSLQNNLLLQDDLYKHIWTHSKQSNFTVEERTLDGKTYKVEVYPAPDQYQQGGAYYFDDAGTLVYFVADAMESGSTEISEQAFTVKVINDQVDETALDLSDYTIQEQ